MRYCVFFTILFPFFLWGEVSESVFLRRVKAHLLLEDFPSALDEALEAQKVFPTSKELAKVLIEAFAANGMEEEALDTWNGLSLHDPSLLTDRYLLEEMCWGILHKGLRSNQYGVRLAALIGAYLTKDARAVKVLVQMMRDSNAMIRSVALQMASSYGDAALKDEVARLLEEEKVWMVRLEAMKAAGALRMKSLSPRLQEYLMSEKASLEEKEAAIGSLVQMYDDIEEKEWKALVFSNRAGLRHLACALALHFDLPDVKDDLIGLLRDPHSGVRIAAINALGLSYRKQMEKEEVKSALQGVLQDADPFVAMTASWCACLVDPSFGQEFISPWLQDPLPEHRRFAAAALSATGDKCLDLSKKILQETQDSYVWANLSQGLLALREETDVCAERLSLFLKEEKRMWMRDRRKNPLFSVLCPSQVRHHDQIPNYPEAVDQMTRLEVISLLASLEDPRALDALREFLQRKSWGVTGFAAATLLQEGNEQTLDMLRALFSF